LPRIRLSHYFYQLINPHKNPLTSVIITAPILQVKKVRQSRVNDVPNVPKWVQGRLGIQTQAAPRSAHVTTTLYRLHNISSSNLPMMGIWFITIFFFYNNITIDHVMGTWSTILSKPIQMAKLLPLQQVEFIFS